MSLFAIGDLHLHFSSECRAPMQRTDPLWKNHTQKLRANCNGSAFPWRPPALTAIIV